ncbi:endo-1,4-beta-xylanase [Vibrio agarivorans]|uniref:endo-1,4-beta-xylanase n=1 Tax=Vibrio agarivorans TaxID=153622 RepID=UPI00222F5883|nr:endo-1,4-beta-xylanase [Vibrio agarivorans]
MKWNSVCLLLGTSVALQGCLLDSADTETVEIPQPEVESLHALADGYPIGTALPAGDAENSVHERNDLQVLLKQHFNQITAENIMKPQYLQPTQGEFFFDDAEALIGFAQEFNATVHGHTLVWHSQIPDWMKACASASECSDIMVDHVTAVVSQFEGKVQSWDVVNEAFNDDGSYRDEGESGSVWYHNIGKEYIAQAFTAARAADSTAKLYYNDYNIEYNGAKLDAVLTMVDELNAVNAPIDGIGFQMHVGLEQPTIDVISAALKRAADTGLQVKITELDTRLNHDGSYSMLTADLAEKQQHRYQEIIEAYLDIVPDSQRGGISVWGVSDADSWIRDLYGNPDWPLLFDDQLAQKPAIQGFADGLAGAVSEPEFIDTFEAGVYWYEDGASSVNGEFVHNAEAQTMDLNIQWSNDGDKYVVARAFDEQTIDFTTARTLSFDIYVPAEVGSDGVLAIQPFIMDGTYTPAYLGYQFGYTAGDWATVTISNIDPDFEFGWSGDPDFTAIDRVGLEFIANGGQVPQGTIQIDNVTIR